MNEAITIPLPACITRESEKDLRDGVELFFQTLVQKINFSIEGDIGFGEAKLREAFSEFITMHHVLGRPARVQSDDPEHDVFYLEDRAVKLLRKLGV